VPVIQVIPASVVLLTLVSLSWRLAIWFGRGNWPSILVRRCLVLVAFSVIVGSFGWSFNLEMAVSVLVTGYALKVLEMKSRRDALVVVYIGFFVVATGGLYSQSLVQGLYLLVCITALVAAMQALYQPSYGPFQGGSPTSSIRFAAVMMVQAVPLTLVLFVFIPRMGPFWVVSWPSTDARTGLSESMSPGDIARLSRSYETVFRAEFEGRIPEPEERYWRAMVLDQYDGREWRKISLEDLQLPVIPSASEKALDERFWMTENPETSGWWLLDNGTAVYDYLVMLEPGGQRWLPVLGPAYASVEQSQVLRTMTLESREPVFTRKVYRPDPRTPLASSITLPGWLRALNTFLPASVNPESRALALKLYKAAGQDPMAMARGVMAYFRQAPFFYTLNPPLMGNDEIDDFLFHQRQGFCEHYASSFVFLMRSVGIPARIVTGFQGGEYLTGARLLLVRQLDAHAWAEIWVDGAGWIRFDPTAAVSPERIESGLEAFASQQEGLQKYLPFVARLGRVPFYKTLQLGWERLEYRWQKSVIQYMKEQQSTFMQQLFGSSDYYWQQMGVMGILFAVILILVAGVIMFQRRVLSTEYRLWLRFERRLSGKGYYRRAKEGPRDFASRVAREDPAIGK
ncbi:MAG: transglutaminase TgpA family protein, partial [Endozoicomonas sp.]